MSDMVVFALVGLLGLLLGAAMWHVVVRSRCVGSLDSDVVSSP